MKCGTAPGLDGFPLVCLKKGGITVSEWLVKLFNVRFDVVGCTYGLAWCMYSAAIQREG